MKTLSEALNVGARDIRRAAQILASRVPARLAPLAEVAYKFSWTGRRDGEQLFRSIDACRWRACRQNPVRLLQEAPEESLERAAITPSTARCRSMRGPGHAQGGAREIGAIEIEDRFSLVEVSDHIAEDAIRASRGTSLRGQRVTVRRDQPRRATK